MREIKVLLIEDNHDDIELLKAMFEEAGCSLSSFVTAEELAAGIELLEHNNFEVVLLDISLPDSHGPETFYKLHDKASDIPIVVITGNRKDELIENLLQNGVQDYLIKGEITPNSLVHSIHYAIERQRLFVSLNHKNQEVQALRESLEHIITNNADGILVVDQGGIVRFANPVGAAIFHRTQKEIVGSNFCYEIDVGKTLELEIEGQDGVLTIAEVRTVEISWDNQPAYLASVRDVTKQKKVQNEIKRLSFYDSLTGLYNRTYFEEAGNAQRY